MTLCYWGEAAYTTAGECLDACLRETASEKQIYGHHVVLNFPTLE